MGKTTECFPGNPIFGSKENKIMLQGLTVASLDSCSSSFNAYAPIKPQVRWINTVILDCGAVKNIQNGKISLDKKSKTSVGATATVECDQGYLASQQKIVCLNTGKWQKSICAIKDCGPVKKMLRGRVILDKTKTSTYGATATVKCSPGYRPNQKKIVCLDTGEWETARCKIKGNVQYLLDPNELPTLITSKYMILKI
ncbi:sushi, von Willebrand factor type A, EGF and pentraxin domain-containing protein 1-like [Ruditapes philippinarum]|uniref:sushi, von Willebrand factor type A, EGF and pentraxin domain-containing protein 1-like n=1 Tax=Ruditapes philippinarum TaxID=129788 RepID=UPI00295B1EE4|nr:sushi, von Willebrand factor type A, EGF and pentraxin domain-containing protein 1-like [Ruditapes philippinarum]